MNFLRKCLSFQSYACYHSFLGMYTIIWFPPSFYIVAKSQVIHFMIKMMQVNVKKERILFHLIESIIEMYYNSTTRERTEIKNVYEWHFCRNEMEKNFFSNPLHRRQCWNWWWWWWCCWAQIIFISNTVHFDENSKYFFIFRTSRCSIFP